MQVFEGALDVDGLIAQYCSAYGAATDTIRRSINLALSKRGEEALDGVGLLDEIMATTVPMFGRVIHDHNGDISFQSYGNPTQHISSVARDHITRLLLNKLDKHDNVTVQFNRKLRHASPSGDVVFVESDDDGRDVRGGKEDRLDAALVVGADGAFSRVREAMLRGSRVDFSRSFIEHSYKEFHLSPAEDAAAAIAAGDKEGGYRLAKPHGLHIWPRHEFMLIALPNPDRTFTCTLFAPDSTFAELDAAISAEQPERVEAFFEEHFPDALEHIGRDCIVSQYSENPTGSLVTVRVKPWRLGRLLLVGDAAHAVVPFFGQGMNAAFEDALEFNASLERCGDDLDAAAEEFALRRQPAGEGLADLSLENYAEMRSHTASPLWVLSKQIEGVLHAVAPTWWVPRYSMVSFARVPYDKARDIAHRQEHALSVAGGVLVAGMAAAALAGGFFLARDASTGFARTKSIAASAASVLGLSLPTSDE